MRIKTAILILFFMAFLSAGFLYYIYLSTPQNLIRPVGDSDSLTESSKQNKQSPERTETGTKEGTTTKIINVKEEIEKIKNSNLSEKEKVQQIIQTDMADDAKVTDETWQELTKFVNDEAEARRADMTEEEKQTEAEQEAIIQQIIDEANKK